MSKEKLRRFRRMIAVRNRRRQHPVLARALGKLSDSEIDSALQDAGLTRARLFTARDAIAGHRVRMAHMLAAWEIDENDAVAENWGALKEADETCALCTQAGRCRRWLEWGRTNEASRVFCPNAALFLQISAEQAKRSVGRYLM